MRILFDNTSLKEGNIEISLDGGFTFKSYDIAEVKNTGISLPQNQELDKIKIKGPANHTG